MKGEVVLFEEKSRKREKIPYGKKSNLFSRKNEFLGKLIDNNIV